MSEDDEGDGQNRLKKPREDMGAKNHELSMMRKGEMVMNKIRILSRMGSNPGPDVVDDVEMCRALLSRPPSRAAVNLIVAILSLRSYRRDGRIGFK